MNLSQLFTEKRTLLLSAFNYLFIFFIFWTRPLRTRNVEGKILERTEKKFVLIFLIFRSNPQDILYGMKNRKTTW